MVKRSNFSKETEKDWLSRIELIKNGERPRPIKQRNYYYLIRNITWKKYKEAPTTYEHFKYETIYKLEDKYGYTREDLNITAKPDGTLYSRERGTELIEYNQQLFPATCVIVTEKSGIAESLSEYLLKYGIFVIDTTGVRGRYPNQYVAKVKVPKFCIEDFDITGCLMAKKFKEECNCERISLLDIMAIEGIKWKDVVEVDTTGHKNNHWNSLYEKDKKLLYKNGKYQRVEIDTVMKFMSPEKFAEVILYLLDNIIPIKDMSEVMELGEYIYVPLIPEIEKEKIIKRINKLNKKYLKQQTKVLEKYEELEEPFEDLDLDVLEEEAKEKYEKMITKEAKK